MESVLLQIEKSHVTLRRLQSSEIGVEARFDLHFAVRCQSSDLSTVTAILSLCVALSLLGILLLVRTKRRALIYM